MSRRGGRGRERQQGGRGRGQPQRSGGRQGSISPNDADQRIRSALGNARITAEIQTLNEGQLVHRPDEGGVSGRRIQVQANFFKLASTLNAIYHYDIVFQSQQRTRQGADDPETPDDESIPSRLRKELLKKCASENGWIRAWAFDGRKNVYAPVKLIDGNVKRFSVSLSRQDRPEVEFHIVVTHVATVPLTNITRYQQRGDIALPRSAIQALEVCLKSAIGHEPNCKLLARSVVFDNPETNTILSGGIELWQGHSQSVHLTEDGLALNVDIAFAAIIKEQSALEMIQSLTNSRGIGDLRRLGAREWKNLSRELKGLDITVTHRETNRKFKCVKITDKSAERSEFTLADGSKANISSYWTSKNYGHLQYPWLPCLDVSKGKKINYLPLEVCRIAGGQLKDKLTEDQTRDFIKHSALKPLDRNRSIQQSLEHANFNRNPIVQDFKLTVDNRQTTVNARVLPRPYLQYQQPACVDPGDRGAWNLADVKLYRSATLKSWAVVSFARNTPNIMNDLTDFVNSFEQMMHKMGMQVPSAPPPVINAERMDIASALTQAISAAQQEYSEQADFVMVLLPRRDPALYKDIKGTAEGTVGVITQCIVAPQAGIGRPARGREQYQANVVMKINHKLGGTNCRLLRSLSTMFPPVGAMQNRPYIFFGGDVTHPITHNEAEPSVGALVASMDPDMGQFAAKPFYLGHRQEKMDMSKAVKELLLTFHEKNRVKPDTIIFYRDGISDGQFESVSAHEYQQFRNACQSLDENYEPRITYVVVKKKHRARFTPLNNNDGDRNGNILPGTTIDRGVTSKHDFDFYLNSHAGIQGTNKAAHYHVLIDENGFGSDGIQLMTNWISYLYCRCTRSVSYAPPAYYAHHAALHGKYLLHSESDTASSHTATEPLGALPDIHRNLADKMFFI